ncbi:metallophosphoesterase family protein [Candidatus Micrarchaeota archaeon]|nr:metallophosphoesterase family protein [Candidatus Micrarchaeota archaeon]
MKIAIMSDFHLGFGEDALEQARFAIRKAIAAADFVILAGDLFDARVPKQETVNEALKLFYESKPDKSMLKMKIASEDGEKDVSAARFVAIYGTHERRTKGLVNAVQLLDSAGLVINVHARKLIVEKEGEKVAVQGMGGVPEEVAERTLKLMNPLPVERAFNIFIFHQNLRELIPVAEESLSAEDLPRGFDIYIDGHIHWAQEIRAGEKRIIIPGSTVVTQMKKNETAAKGFFLFDTKKWESEFVSIPSRPFFYSEIEFKEATPEEVEKDVRVKLEELLSSAKGKAALVKLKLKGTLAKGITSSNIDLKTVERDYAETMKLTMDKDFFSEELKEKIDFIKRMREEKKSVKETGLEILKRKLAEKSYSLGKEEELFELLSQGETEAALREIGA